MLTNNNVVSGNNFSVYADIIFSERVSSDKYPSLKKGNFYKIIERVENIYSSDVWFVNKKFTIKKNSTIFCKTESLELLFYLIQDIPKEYELNLITHQSDITIDEKKFKKKPECIKEWFAVNVSFINENLHHIPLGISEEFRKRHLNVDYLEEMQLASKKPKNKFVYINYNPNTNEKIRSKILKKLKNENFISFGSYGLEIKKYIEDLKSNQYILCPTGNGLDTYRLWESLIIGSDPVVNSVLGYREFRSLPIYFFNNTEKLNLDLLESKSYIVNELKNNLEDNFYLTTEYWMESLLKQEKKSNELEDISIIIDENLEKKYFRKFFFIKNFKSNLKIVRFYLYQYLNIFNYFRFILRKLKIIDSK